ncbi:MAG: TIM barrel protein [Novosphingobium sp.]|nr:TIM barrel protein [Novosphingobium sp.]
MKRPLGLHQSSAMDITPLELIKAASLAGYDCVSLFTNNPSVPIDGKADMFVFPQVREETRREVLDCLDATGLTVINAEFFLMKPDIALESYIPGLALGRELGARHAITHVFETEPARAVEILGTFCDLAGAQDLTVALEFCQMTPGCKSIEQATWFVDQVGKSNLGFGICPMHLVRSGGTAGDVSKRADKYVLYGQVNDGKGLHTSPAYFEEVHDRELPGDGDFPLHDILSALPADAPIEVKIPRDSRIKAGGSAQDYISRAFERTRALVDGLKPVAGAD